MVAKKLEAKQQAKEVARRVGVLMGSRANATIAVKGDIAPNGAPKEKGELEER